MLTSSVVGGLGETKDNGAEEGKQRTTVSKSMTSSSDSTKKFSSGAIRLSFDTTHDIMKLPLEMKGFCPYTLVSRKGLLLPGNVEECGLVQFQNRYYSFISNENANKFAESPKSFLSEARVLLKRIQN